MLSLKKPKMSSPTLVLTAAAPVAQARCLCQRSPHHQSSSCASFAASTVPPSTFHSLTLHIRVDSKPSSPNYWTISEVNALFVFQLSIHLPLFLSILAQIALHRQHQTDSYDNPTHHQGIVEWHPGIASRSPLKRHTIQT
jgi:hypothetical protein